MGSLFGFFIVLFTPSVILTAACLAYRITELTLGYFTGDVEPVYFSSHYEAEQVRKIWSIFQSETMSIDDWKFLESCDPDTIDRAILAKNKDLIN